MVNTSSETDKKSSLMVFYERMKFRAQLSWVYFFFITSGSVLVLIEYVNLEKAG